MLNNTLAKLQKHRAERTDDDGFTLIELLVVVVIIGILIAIAIPLYLNYQTGAQNKSAQSDVRNAVTAIESCYTDNNTTYPGTTGTDVATSSSISSLGMTCIADGTGTVHTTAATTDQQVINVSNNVILTYTKDSTTSYHVKATYGTGHKTYTYTSTTGKTVTS